MNLEELYKISIYASIEAGKAIMDIYTNNNIDVKYKEDKSPLTIADREANKRIVELLENTQIPIISEEIEDESYSVRKNWNLYWLIDPLDGTKEFIKKNGEFTVNIALIKNGVPIWGVIYVPDQKVLYYGGEDIGAYKIERIDDFNRFKHLEHNKLSLDSNKKNDSITVVASKSHLSEDTLQYVDKLKNNYSKIDFLSVGSSLKLCMVAEGKADVYPRFAPTMEWDTGAGHAICRAMNISVVDTDTGKELVYNKENLLNPYFIVNDKVK